MAKSSKGPKAGDKSPDGQFVRTQGGNWRNISTGKIGTPGAAASGGGAAAAGGATWQDPYRDAYLNAAKRELQQQVGTGQYNISQGQADAEYNRLASQQMNPSVSGVSLGNPNDVINTQLGLNRQQALQGNTLTNPNQYNPFGQQTTTIDPITGQPTVTQGLSGANQQAVGGIQNSGINASQVLQSILGNGQNGTFGALSGGGNNGQLSQYSQSIYDQLTKGVMDQKAREQEQTEQSLANRGIPVGSQDYRNVMKDFNVRYDDIISNAKNQAVTGGVSAATNLLPGLSSIGQSGYIQPSYQGFQSVPYGQVDVNQLFSTLTSKEIAQMQSDTQRSLAGGRGGGGGGSSTPALRANNPAFAAPPGS